MRHYTLTLLNLPMKELQRTEFFSVPDKFLSVSESFLLLGCDITSMCGLNEIERFEAKYRPHFAGSIEPRKIPLAIVALDDEHYVL